MQERSEGRSRHSAGLGMVLFGMQWLHSVITDHLHCPKLSRSEFKIVT
jgi:hypothetical protein